MSETPYDSFIRQVREVYNARSIVSLLEWDQETYMPRRGAAHRADQVALIAGLAHQKLTSEAFAESLARLEREGVGDDPVRLTNLREMRREFDRAVKIPTALVQEIARASALAKEAWVRARQESRFADFAPHLEKLLDLKREVARHIGWQTEPYDALMDEFEPGAQAAAIQNLFDRLRAELVPLVAAIVQAPRQPDLSVLERFCPRDAQAEFNRRVAAALGFDFEAGRLDVSAHPFCTSTCPLDVRITTRYDEKYLPQSLFGVMHETGHALYEQGLDVTHAGTPAGSPVSLGIHESQSRLWENLVGRSRPFWEHFFPALQEQFPSLADVSLDDWYFAINNVRPSLIRVEADEVTYGLHIMLRFDLERQMVAGRLAVRDVPEAWNEAMRSLLGIVPPDDARGCLQDIHWSMGIFGYFPTYALGNLYAAQFFEAARAALPDLDGQIRRGEFQPLRQWLQERIHRLGMRYRAHELVRVVTDRELSHEPFLRHLRGKFGALYGLS